MHITKILIFKYPNTKIINNLIKNGIKKRPESFGEYKRRVKIRNKEESQQVIKKWYDFLYYDKNN